MKRAAGFTLLEVLVALAVLGLILAGLAGGLRFGIDAQRRQAASTGEARDLPAVDRALRRLIEQMEPGSRLDGNPITGDATSLRFTTRLPLAGTALPERVRVALLVRAGQLVLRWQPAPHATPIGVAPPVHETPLMQDVVGLRVSYRAGSGQWQTSWNSPALPALVQLRITFASQHADVWPDIVVAPCLR